MNYRVAVKLRGGLVATMAATGIFVLAGSGCDGLGRDCAFDESAWTAARAATPTNYELASPVAEDVVKCEELVYGKDRQEVVQLLGRPDWRSKEKDVWGYEVGVPEDLSDYPGLVITFDIDGVVETVEIPGYYER